MKRPRSHQIDELAQRVFRDALPESWIVNEQHSDYGKDYHIELTDKDGQLTGKGIFVQLKGQECVAMSADGTVATFSLESRHASYYGEKVRDLPLFLVLVDVNKKKGWWLFLQELLFHQHEWRHQKSITVHLPMQNDLCNVSMWTDAIDNSKDWMRKKFPAFHTPFLDECADYLFEQGLDSLYRYDNGMTEYLQLFYFPTLPNGIPAFDVERSQWDFYGGSDPDCNLRIRVSSLGHFELMQGDDDGIYLDLHITSPEEIEELLYLLHNLTEDNCGQAECVRRPLSDLVDDLGILIPLHDTHIVLTPDEFVSASPDEGAMLDAILSKDDDGWKYLMENGFGGWGSWCRLQLKAFRLKDHKAIRKGGLIYSSKTGLCSYRRYRAYGMEYRDEPAFAVSLNRDKCSPMYLSDSVNHMERSGNSLRSAMEEWRDFKRKAASVFIESPLSILDQIRMRVEARTIEVEHRRD